MLRLTCHTDPVTTDDLVARNLTASERLDRLRPAVQAGVPWRLADRFDHAPEAMWGPNELLAHVAEMLSFWLGEVERILAGPPEPVPFGRVGTDPIRIAIIGRDRSLPIGELYARIHNGLERWTDRLTTLTSAQLEKEGVHPRLGDMSVQAIVERQVVNHLDEHIRQLEAILGVAETPA
jgi:hypothetical protein